MLAYSLADRLGVPLGVVFDMTYAEVNGWVAYYRRRKG
jgi:hypothetical protein